MEIRFTESQVFVDTYHAWLGKHTVGMVRKDEHGRFKAIVYRYPGDDYEATVPTRQEAEEFVKANVAVPIQEE